MKNESKAKLQELRLLFEVFEKGGEREEIRPRVLALIPVFDSLRELGKSLVPGGLQMAARDRIISYLRHYPRIIIHEKELAIVAGISEWARRVRELRVQFGWKIVSGITVNEMLKEGEFDSDVQGLDEIAPNDYILLDENEDRDAAYRWRLGNDIRKRSGGGKAKILAYLRANIGKPITGEELSYVAKNSTEWARRTRELRTEEGWPITTRLSGNPSLPIGVYLLEADRQVPAHDRKIKEAVRRRALRRDKYACRKCGWTHDSWNRSDPRFLELHHLQHHADGGENTFQNLMTVCNVCHDEIHRSGK